MYRLIRYAARLRDDFRMKIAEGAIALILLAVAFYLARKLLSAWRFGSIRFSGASATVHRSIDPKSFWGRMAWVAAQLAFALFIFQGAVRALFDLP